ncbi:MAG: AMP-binding protein [Pseudomonadota bacterium]
MQDILAALTGHAQARPDDEALFEGARRLSFAGFDAAADRLAARLAARGAGPGALLVWIGSSGLDRVVFVVAAHRAGAAVACPDLRGETAEVSARIAAAAAQGAVAAAGWEGVAARHGVADPLVAPDPMDAAPAERFAPVAAPDEALSNLRYTSGSTGAPKIVPISRATEAYFDRLAAAYSRIGPQDRLALLGHLWPAKIFAALIGGARMGCFDAPALSPGALAEAFADEGVTMTMTYPAIFRQLMAAGRPLPALRHATLAGEPVTRADVEAFEALSGPGSELNVTFGSNEFPWVARWRQASGAPLPWNTVPVGEPTDPASLRLVDAGGAEAGPGEAGEMEIVSAHLPPSYHGDPASAALFRPLGDGRRAFRTGDMAYRDVDGVIHSLGRRDEQVKIRGYNVRPTEIEPLLEARGDVTEAAVTAVEGAGGVRRLACHYAGAAEPETLRADLAARLPAYMTPTVWMRLPALPRTATDKIRRQALPDPLKADAAPPDAAWRTEPERVFAALFAELLGRSDFGREDDFFDLGGDSLQAMTLVLEAERRLGRRLPLETLVVRGASVRALGAAAAEGAGTGAARLRRGDGRQGPILTAPIAQGHLGPYLEMLHALDPRWGVMALYPVGLGGEAPATRMEDLAAHVLAQAEAALEGEAPAALLGYSFGAFVAAEMARALALRDGAAAAPPLVMIDPESPRRLGRWTSRAWRVLTREGPLAAGGRAARLAAEGAGRGDALEAAHRRAGLDYAPAPFQAGPALILTSTDRRSGAEARAWRRLLGGGARVRALPHDHFEMMKGAGAGLTAQAIQAWLAEVGAGGGAGRAAAAPVSAPGSAPASASAPLTDPARFASAPDVA